MATIAKLQPGQVLFDLQRQTMGNTTIRRTACYSVRVVEIAPDHSFILASWNNNPPRKYREREVKRLRIKKPEPKGTVGGLPSY
jgi:hypothetical protein